MGIATKYVKDRGKDPTGIAPDLLPIEEDFYESLNPKVYIDADSSNPDATLIYNRLRYLWEQICFKGGNPEEIFDDAFKGAYSHEQFIDDKESNLSRMARILDSRSTIEVRLVGRECTVVRDSAFIVSDYTWEYKVQGKEGRILWREDGVYIQTWIRRDGEWRLMGQYVDQSYVEPVQSFI